MFDGWADAGKALAAIVLLTVVARLWANARTIGVQRLFEPEVPADPSRHKPVDAIDMRYSVIGQLRGDKTRVRRIFFGGLFAAVCVQLLPLNGYLSSALVIGVAVTVGAGARGFERIEARLALDDEIGRRPDGETPTVAEELNALAWVALKPSITDPFSGRWRLLGVPASAATIGIALIGWRAALGLFGAEMRDVGNPLRDLVGVQSATLLALAGVAVIVLARLPLELAQRFALAKPRRAGSYPIVLLRSFKDDRLSIRADGTRGMVDLVTLRRLVNYERVLVASAKDFGPVLALGQPGERMPPVGAFRVYFDHDNWKVGVTSLLENATFLVVSLGETPSVAWEITRLKELGMLERTVFVVPPVPFSARQERLQLLSEQLDLDPVVLRSVSSPKEVCVAVMFKKSEPVLLMSSGYDATSYYGALFEAAASHFDASVSADVGEQR